MSHALEKRVDKLENRVQANLDLDREIEELLSNFSKEEQAALIEEFIATHEFFDPSRLSDEDRARNVWLQGG